MLPAAVGAVVIPAASPMPSVAVAAFVRTKLPAPEIMLEPNINVPELVNVAATDRLLFNVMLEPAVTFMFMPVVLKVPPEMLMLLLAAALEKLNVWLLVALPR